MNKIIGNVTVKQESILHGDHNIVTAVKIVDNTAVFPAGTLLVSGSDGYEPLAASDTTATPVAVALEDLETKASGAVIQACIHGAVRAEKLTFKDGSAVTSAAAEKLRASGIYSIAGEGFSGYAE